MSRNYSPPPLPRITLLLALLLGSVNTSAKVIYVDDDATGANDGTSWENAYFYLQDALMFAAAGDEIRVVEGVCRPGDFVLSDRPNREREETFTLLNNVAIRGGYAGFGEPDPDARDVNEYETILTGDRENNDAAVADAADLLSESSREDNCYHVVTAHETDEAATGGAIANDGYSDPTLTDCNFTGNRAERGGAFHNTTGMVSL